MSKTSDTELLLLLSKPRKDSKAHTTPGGVRGSQSAIFEVDQTLGIISMDLKLSNVEITMHLFNIAIRFLQLPLKIEWCLLGGQ